MNAYTDGMMENGIGVDDYLALCEYIGMTPSLTIRFQMGQDADVQVIESDRRCGDPPRARLACLGSAPPTYVLC